MPMPVPVRSVNTHPRLMNWLCVLAIALLALVLASPTMAEKGKLRERLTPEVMAVVYPDAERLGLEEGTPPAIAVYKGDKMVAYVFSTLDIVAATGYSTTPFDVIGGVDLDGRITGAKVVFHNENYIVHDTARQRLLNTFLARERARHARSRACHRGDCAALARCAKRVSPDPRCR
jgi:transcriptional regulator of nitric oxide reductase